MPEQVVIEFVGNADALQPAVDTIDHLTGAGTKLNTEFKKTTQVFGDTTKASQVAHISIDQLSQSVRDLNKNVIGNDAQNKVKELGTQFASSANEGKKLTTELRELKDQLSRLAQSGQAGTAEFAKLQAEAAKVQNQVNNTNKSIQLLSQSGGAIRALTTVVSGLAGSFALAQGAAALFGGKNKDLEKTLLKVQAVMLILNGLTSVQAALEEKAAIKTALYGTALKVVTAIQNAFTISAEAAWAAATGGIALLITAITGVILFFRQGTEDAASSTDKLKTALDELAASFDKVEIRAGNVAAVNKRVLQDQEDLIQRLIDTNASAATIYNAQLKLIELKKKANADEITAEEAKLKILQDQQSELFGVIARMGEFAQATDTEVADAKKQFDELGKKVAAVKNRIFELKNNTQDFVTETVSAGKQLTEAQIKNAEILVKELERIRLLRLKEDETLNLALTEAEINAWKHRNDAVKALYDTDVKNATDAIDKILAAQTAALHKGFTDEDSARKKNFSDAQIYTQALGQLGSTLFDYTTTLNQNEIDALEDKHRRGLISEKAYNKAIAEMRRKQALAEKEKAAFSISVDTAKGIISALGSDPPNVPLAAIIAATGASELAVVLSKKLPEVPKFAAGTESVKGGVRGKDSVPAVLMPGERVVPTEINEKLRGIPNAELPKLLDVYPETPYISDATLDSIERGRSNHTGIDYELLGKSVAKYIAKQPRLSVNIDERGFEKRIFEEGNKQQSLDNHYTWSG